jgi:hypothetical protein
MLKNRIRRHDTEKVKLAKNQSVNRPTAFLLNRRRRENGKYKKKLLQRKLAGNYFYIKILYKRTNTCTNLLKPLVK